jgi:PHD/YefM family antitoxin component YafN of YafNO toxin-antitoxin module
MFTEPGRVEEPQAGQDYSAILSRVASEHKPVIVRCSGEDIAAIVPLEHMEVLQDALARQEAEKIAAQIDWGRLAKSHAPAQQWFDGDEPKLF